MDKFPEGIQPIRLSCLYMPNNEILFNGRSLGFLREGEQKYIEEDN